MDNPYNDVSYKVQYVINSSLSWDYAGWRRIDALLITDGVVRINGGGGGGQGEEAKRPSGG